MKKNVGTADKWIRIIIGLFLLSLVFFGPKTAWGWLGLIPLITAFVGFCPLYLPFKISTKKEEVKSQP
jgi:membrane protein implicated in regulation of membrane protease activity